MYRVARPNLGLIAQIDPANNRQIEAATSVGTIDMGLATIARRMDSVAAGDASVARGPEYLILNTTTTLTAGASAHWFAVAFEVLPPRSAQTPRTDG